MKGWIAVGLIGVIVLAGAGALALGGDSAAKSTNGPHVVAVSGTASVSTAPDEAIVSLGTRTEAPNPLDAQSQNAVKMAAVMKALSANRVTKDDVKSTNITLNHQTQNRGTKHQQTVYVAQNQVDATIHDLSSVGAVVDAAVKAGATSVGDIRFQLSNQLAARQKALSAAVKGAEQKAQIMAQAAGTSLGPVVSIREQGSSLPRPVFAQASPSAALGAVPTPVSPPSGIQTRVTVDVVWSLSS